MSNQARELATNSINEYVEFFRQFRKPNKEYPLPEEIITREYGPDDEFEKTFLKLKIEVQGIEIGFQRPQCAEKEEKNRDEKPNTLTAIKNVLVKVVQHMVKAIDNIPRPDT
jgi:hypothetical protein